MFETKRVWVRLLWAVLLIGTMSLGPAPAQAAQTAVPEPIVSNGAGAPAPAIQVALTAPQTSISWDSRLAEPIQLELPLLYLHHGTTVAPAAERTLTLHLVGLPGGTTVEVEATSWHADPMTQQRHRQRAPLDLPAGPCTVQAPCAVQWTLDPAAESDLYRLALRDDAGRLLWENPDPEQPDLVALDTWDVAVPGYTVRIYYATLFPFARGEANLDHRLAPGAVRTFIAQHFAPLVAETWHTQFTTWGFGPIHPDWDADRVVEIVITTPPFALLGGTGIYTASYHADGSPYMERRLWWFSSSPAYDVYDSLENGYRVILAHEFYHMAQWNTLLSAGCGMKVWNNLFIEAQAKFAPAVQYPEIEILGAHVAGAGSAYQSAARHFVAQRLNASYADLEADTVDRYDWAPYWRFLYEQLGGIEIARVALEEMACRYDPDLEATLPGVMDAALARVGGPFQGFEESLVAFAEAIYALTLENGRCAVENAPECAHRFYDPNHTYKAPSPEAEVAYRGAPVAWSGSIPAGFGVDLVQIRLDRELGDQPLQIAFQGSGRFRVRLWKLGAHGARAGALALASDTGYRAAAPLALTAHPTAMAKEGDLYVAQIPALDTLEWDQLALIIVRLDAGQGADASGDYTITLDATDR